MEKTICRYPELGQLDQDVHDKYFQLRNALSGNGRAQLLASQQQYLSVRDTCASSHICLQKRMQARVIQLKRVAALNRAVLLQQEAGTAAQLDVKRLQELLNANGFDAGTPDGVAGPRTQRAAEQYLRSRGRSVAAARALEDAYAALLDQTPSGALKIPSESIDCTKARTATDGAICAVPELRTLDQNMTASYRAATERANATEAGLLLQQQRAWLVSRDTCGASVKCLSNSMQTRIAELKSFETAGGADHGPQAASVDLTRQEIMAVQGLIAAFAGNRTVFAPDGVIGPNTLAGASDLAGRLRVGKTGKGPVADLYRWLTSQQGEFGEFRGTILCGGNVLPVRHWFFDDALDQRAAANSFLLVDDMAYLARSRFPIGGRSELSAFLAYPDTAPLNTTFRARGKVSSDGNDVIFQRVSGGVKRQRCNTFELARVTPNAPLEPVGPSNEGNAAEEEASQPLVVGTAGDLNAGTPLTLGNISGAWRHVRLALGNATTGAGMKYWLAPVPVRIGSAGPSETLVQFDSSAAALSYRHDAQDGLAFLLRPNPGAAASDQGFKAIRPKSHRSGVDILTNENSQLLIRFRPTQAATSLGIDQLDFNGFCQGPAGALAQTVSREKSALDRINTAFDNAVLVSSRVLSHGMFGSPEFKATFGAPFEDMGNDARTELVARLRACALYHPDRQVGDALIMALWAQDYQLSAHAADAYVGQYGRYRGKDLYYEPKTSPGSIAVLIAKSDEARATIASARAELQASGDDLDLAEALAKRIKLAATSLMPSEAESAFHLAYQTLERVRVGRETAQLTQQGSTTSEQPAISQNQDPSSFGSGYRLAVSSSFRVGLPMMRVYIDNDPCADGSSGQPYIVAAVENISAANDDDVILGATNSVNHKFLNSLRHQCQALLKRPFLANVIMEMDGVPVVEASVSVTPGQKGRPLPNLVVVSKRTLAAPKEPVTELGTALNSFFDRFGFDDEFGPFPDFDRKRFYPEREENYDLQQATSTAISLENAYPQLGFPLGSLVGRLYESAQSHPLKISDQTREKYQALAAAGSAMAANRLIRFQHFDLMDIGAAIRQQREISGELLDRWRQLLPTYTVGIENGAFAAYDFQQAMILAGAQFTPDGFEYEVYDGPRREDVERGLYRTLSTIRNIGALGLRGKYAEFADIHYSCDGAWCDIGSDVGKWRMISRGRPNCRFANQSEALCRFVWRFNVQLNTRTFGFYSLHQRFMTTMNQAEWFPGEAVFSKQSGQWEMVGTPKLEKR